MKRIEKNVGDIIFDWLFSKISVNSVFVFCLPSRNVWVYLAVCLHVVPEILAEVAHQTGNREV